MSDMAERPLYRSIRGAAIWSGIAATSLLAAIVTHELAAIQDWPADVVGGLELLLAPVFLLLWVWGGMAVVDRVVGLWQSERLPWGVGQ